MCGPTIAFNSYSREVQVSVIDIRDVTREQDVVHTRQFSLVVLTQDHSTPLRHATMYTQYAQQLVLLHTKRVFHTKQYVHAGMNATL